MARQLIDSAQRIHDKVMRTDTPIAVFIIEGKARTCLTTSDLFNQGFKSRPHNLLGVYDKRAPLDFLEEDLKFADQTMN